MLPILALVGCATPEERHFGKIAEIQCEMQQACTPHDFVGRFDSVDHCIDESEIGVQLYAEACVDFDRLEATHCRRFMREAARTCELDTSDARYEDYCLHVCSNYQGEFR
jgi:hypothetical protein